MPYRVWTTPSFKVSESTLAELKAPEMLGSSQFSFSAFYILRNDVFLSLRKAHTCSDI